MVYGLVVGGEEWVVEWRLVGWGELVSIVVVGQERGGCV